LCRCKIVARFASNVSQAQKSFWTHTMELLGDLGHVESRFGPFGDSANLDARYVHVLHECTIGFEIVLDLADRTPR
jgi:hypothetical protein